MKIKAIPWLMASILTTAVPLSASGGRCQTECILSASNENDSVPGVVFPPGTSAATIERSRLRHAHDVDAPHIYDEWLTQGKDFHNGRGDAFDIAKNALLPVAPYEQARAKRILNNASFRILNMSQVQALTGAQVKVKPSGAPYLIRAISIGWGTEALSVTECSDGVINSELGALGHPDNTVKIIRKPIVVFLPYAPHFVNVSLSFAG